MRKKRIANTDMCRDSTAKIACQQDRTENGRSRDCVQKRRYREDNPKRNDHRFLIAECDRSFDHCLRLNKLTYRASSAKNKTGKAVTIRPAHIIFREV